MANTKITTNVIADGAITSAKLDTNITISGNITGTLATAAQPNITSLGTLTTLTVDDITINGSTISDGGSLTLDVGGDIILDADSDGRTFFYDGGTEYGIVGKSSNSLFLKSSISDGDILFQGNDGGSAITALTLDMSDAGTAIFNHDIVMGDNANIFMGNGYDLRLQSDGTNGIIYAANGDLTLDVAGDINLDADGADINLKDGGTAMGRLGLENGDLNIASSQQDYDIKFKGNDGGSVITALTLDMSNAGAATFNSNVNVGGIGNVNLSGSASEVSVGVSGDTDNSGGGVSFAHNTSTLNSYVLGQKVSMTIGTAISTPLLFVTNNSERLRIDSSGHVGIGMTPAPVGSDTCLSIYNTVSPRIKLHNSTSGTASGDGAELNTFNSDFIIENREAGNLRLFNNGSERMRITSSGNLEFKSTTTTFTGASSFTNHSNGVLYLRGGTSGLRLDDNDSHNTIHVSGAGNYIAFETLNGTERWRFNSSGHFTPAQQHAYDIGGVNAEVRNIYAQGLYVGGSAAANKLDDYEEGTWTPVVENGTYTYTYRRGHYVKIGNLVHIHIGFKLNAASPGTSVGTISGLPFTSMNYGGYQEPHARVAVAGLCVTANLGSHLSFYKGNTDTKLYARTSSSNSDTQVTSNQIWQAGTFIKLQMSYTVS